MPDKSALISYAVSAAALIAVLVFFDFGEVIAAVSGFNYVLFFPVIFIFFITFVLRALAWKEIAAPVAEISFEKIFHITSFGFLANFALPLRAGEIIRALLFSKTADVSPGKALSTVIVSRSMEAVALALIFVLGAAAFPFLEPSVTATVLLAGAFFVFLIALLVFPGKFFSIAKKTGVAGFIPKKVLGTAKKAFGKTALYGSGKKSLALAFVYTFLVWAVHMVAYAVVAFGLGIRMGFFEMALVLSFSSLFSMIPSSPGSVGTFQAAFVTIFVALGLPAEKGLAMSIILHVAIYVTVIVLGLVSIKSLSVSLSDYAKKAKRAFSSVPIKQGVKEHG